MPKTLLETLRDYPRVLRISICLRAVLYGLGYTENGKTVLSITETEVRMKVTESFHGASLLVGPPDLPISELKRKWVDINVDWFRATLEEREAIFQELQDEDVINKLPHLLHSVGMKKWADRLISPRNFLQ